MERAVMDLGQVIMRTDITPRTKAYLSKKRGFDGDSIAQAKALALGEMSEFEIF